MIELSQKFIQLHLKKKKKISQVFRIPSAAMPSSPPKLVLWITSSTPRAVETLACESTADVVLIDAQHGAFGNDYALELIKSLSTAVGATECAVRVTGDVSDAEVSKFLDAGATTIVCPMVNDRERCERFVSACRYAPVGRRSFGPYSTKQTRMLFGKMGFDVNKANAAVKTMAMIETKKALENLDEILSVEGLDGVFIGPNDLGLSLGFSPTSSPKGEVLETVLRICERTKAKGKSAGIYCSDPQTAKAMIKEGFDFVVVSSDLSLLVNGAKRVLAEARL